MYLKSQLRKAALFVPVLLIAAGSISSCMHSRVRMADAPADSTVNYQKWFFFGGLLPHRKYEVNDLCPGGSVQEVHQRMSGWDVLITTVTLGIAVPQRLEVKCSRNQ